MIPTGQAMWPDILSKGRFSSAADCGEANTRLGDASCSRRIGRKALELRTGRRNDPSLFSDESGGLGLAKSKSFVPFCEQDNVFRQSTSGNYMLKMWQADQGNCQLAQG
jgi:hypothetical protein